jgi:MFS family permease
VLIFYGWLIVAAAVVLTGYHSAMYIYGLTAFITPIATTTNWTYAQISLGSSIRGMQIGALDPIAGLIVDRFSARKLMELGIIFFSLGTICISQASNLAIFYAGFLIAGLGSAFCHNIVPQTVLARWFRKNIGKASGILATGFAIGGLFIPLIVGGIEAIGWRDMMMYLSFGALVLGVPLSLVFRNRPEDYGLFPDGRKSEMVNGSLLSESGFTPREALKMRAFWLIGLAWTFQFASIHAVTVHTIPYLESLGMKSAEAAISVTIFSFVGLGIRLLYGFLADVFAKKLMLTLSNGITAVALVIFGLLDGNSFAMVALFSVVYGFGVSGATPLRTPIAREYFGVRNFGTIYGMLSIFAVIGGITGAPIAGWVYDMNQSYFPIWYVFAGLSVAGAILLLLLPSSNPEKFRSVVNN